MRPDFASFSFYKMMGFPTGVGCLLARRDRVNALARPWFAGGTITIASVQGDGHFLHRDEAAFEDGTVDYLNLPAVADGLDHLERIGVDAIHERVRCLTAWLLDALTGLRHRNGRPVVEVLGPTDTAARGGTITFLLHDRDGRTDRRPPGRGAGQAGRHLVADRLLLQPRRGRDRPRADGLARCGRGSSGTEPVSFSTSATSCSSEHGVLVAAARISVGVASTFADVYRFVCFLQRFVDRTAIEVGQIEFVPEHCRVLRDSA